MTWIKKPVWQLGIAALLVLAGTIIIYISSTNGQNQTLIWAGSGLVWFALFIPLFSKFFGAEKAEDEDKDDENG